MVTLALASTVDGNKDALSWCIFSLGIRFGFLFANLKCDGYSEFVICDFLDSEPAVTLSRRYILYIFYI